MNPLDLIQLKTSYDTFKKNHPKFPLFLNAVAQHGLDEGTIIEISVKPSEGKEYSTNLKLTATDLQLFHDIKRNFTS